MCALCALPRLRAKALITALPMAIRRDMDNLAYRTYITDVLRALIGGSYVRFLDWIDHTPKDDRTGDEIDRELSKKFGWG